MFVVGFEASMFCFSSLVCFVFVFWYYFVLCFGRPSNFVCFHLCFWILGMLLSWVHWTLRSFIQVREGPSRDHLVGGEDSLPDKKLKLRVHNINSKSVGLRYSGKMVSVLWALLVRIQILEAFFARHRSLSMRITANYLIS